MATFTKIASYEASGSVATIDISNIPSTYTDLCIKLSLRVSSTDTPVLVTFNGVTTGYSWRRMYADGSGTNGAQLNDGYFLWAGKSGYTANAFAACEMYISQYSSSLYKAISTESLVENDGTLGEMFMTSALWANASAINQITLTPVTGNLVQYSTVSIYGISNK